MKAFYSNKDQIWCSCLTWVSTPARWGSEPHFLKWTRGSPELVRGQATAGSLTPSQTSRGRCRILRNSSSCRHTVFETSQQVLTEVSTLGEFSSLSFGQSGEWDNIILSACWEAPLSVLFWARFWKTEILPDFFLESHSLTLSVSYVIKWGSWNCLPPNFLFD